MDAVNLAQHLLKSLRERKDRMGESLLSGSIGTMDEYRFVVGQIRGMTYAEDEIRAAMKGMEEDDD
jgi:hypothetical protein